MCEKLRVHFIYDFQSASSVFRGNGSYHLPEYLYQYSTWKITHKNGQKIWTFHQKRNIDNK